MIESLSYHTNTAEEFTVCYNEVHLTTENIFVTPRNKIYEHIYVSRNEPRKYMSFKQAPPRHTNLNRSLHPLHPSERKEKFYSLMDVHRLNCYQRRSSRGPLHMKGSVV